MASDKVEYNRDVVVGILRDLEQIVVSLARTGSAEHSLSKRESDALVSDVVTEWNVTSKLANARAALGGALSREPGTDGLGELERELAETVIWSSTAPSPEANE